jgi:hypothetical protein
VWRRRERRPPGQERAVRQVPRRGAAGDVPHRPEARRGLGHEDRRAQRRQRDDPGHRRDEKNGQNGSFDRQITGTDVADKNRPNFVVDTIPGPGRPKGNEQLDPLERSSAYVNTYTLGPLGPNRTADFEWHVTAVHAGPFRVCYRVAAGLNGKAVAVQQGGKPLFDEFDGQISNAAPKTRVADDGKTVVTEPDTGQQP